MRDSYHFIISIRRTRPGRRPPLLVKLMLPLTASDRTTGTASRHVTHGANFCVEQENGHRDGNYTGLLFLLCPRQQQWPKFDQLFSL